MKKSFLIAGLLASIGATNGYAQSEQFQVSCTCPKADGQRCNCKRSDSNGGRTYWCDCIPAVPVQEPTLSFEYVANLNQGNVVQQSQIESIKPIKQKRANKVSVRVAEMPNVTKKIVYEEVVSDDAE